MNENENQQGYNNQTGYSDQTAYSNQQGYTGQTTYNNQQGYADQTAYNNQQGYAGQTPYGNQQGYADQNGYYNQQSYAGQATYGNQTGYYQAGQNESELAVIPPNSSGSALALGIIGLVLTFIGIPFFGVIGGGIALILGICAIGLGQSAKNKTDRRKGKGGFVLGIITVCFACVMSVGFLVAGLSVRAVAINRGMPLLAKHGSALTFGVIGMLISIGSESDLEALEDEINNASRSYYNIPDIDFDIE